MKKITSLLLAAALAVSAAAPLTAFAAGAQDSAQTGSTAETAQASPQTPDAAQALPNGGISVMSLLPLEEVHACLLLNGYTEEQLKAISVDDILNNLLDRDGNRIEVDPDASVVWTYFKDETGSVIHDEYHRIGRDETVDMTSLDDVSTYTMELIVGSGNQLDPNNKRYLVKVYLTNKVTDQIQATLYQQDADGNRTELKPEYESVTINNQLQGLMGMTIYTRICCIPSDTDTSEYYVGFTSAAEEHPDVDVDVFTFTEFLQYLASNGESGTPITDQIMNQDMTRTDAGYKGYFNMPNTIYETEGFFVLSYRDRKTGNSLGYVAYAVVVAPDISYIEGDMYAVQDGQMVDPVCVKAESWDATSLAVDMETGKVNGAGVTGLYYMLKEGYSADDIYNCVLTAHGTEYGDEANSYVTKAVVGLYDSLEAAEGQPDIKDQLLPTDPSQTPRGYAANYNYEDGGVYFTVFFEDGTIFQFNVRIMGYDSQYDPDYMQEFTSAPIVGAKDPWFRVTGANYDGQPLNDVYVVENGKEINMDTMYGYGYQTILINDYDVDLSKLQPVFEVPDAERVRPTVGSEQISGESTQDFSNGPVQYSTIIDDHTKGYQVSFVKKEHGPKLYVCGPSERSVFLDEYFEEKHDILIANVGDEELTGLKVTLDATHVKLDDYWTVGGEGNDTLAPFTTTEASEGYGELPNLAKIRLLPDGEGEIEGTLTIEADGQEPVVIRLTGRALNPTIVTTALDDAVKYVPYSYTVATNNMYEWNAVTFQMEGTLPEGLELNANTGEIYGVAQQTGSFPITVTANYQRDDYFEPSTVQLTLTVKDNTNDNVYNETDEGYTLLASIGEDKNNDHDFVLTDTGEDVQFWSEGELDEFVDLWLNGEKLEEGVDYTAVHGSTRITISSQTMQNKTNKDGANTIAAEFRTNDEDNELRRTAQNFRIETISVEPQPDTDPDDQGGSGNSGGQGDNGSQGGSGGQSGNSGSGNTVTVTATGGNSSDGQVPGQAAENAAGTASGSTVPQTGDSLPYMLCAVLALVSACGLAGLLIRRRKFSRK